mmetsp:Transcript_47496/g.107765  ORF Transcript_47496/g.107765 Transcript_47496/m.107765 type:complete len:88 (-) Transcript_47496:149-412(-)
MQTQVLGALLLLSTISAFSYFVVWIIVTPLFDDDHLIQSLFPRREWALVGPLIIGQVIFVGLWSWLGLIFLFPHLGKLPRPERATCE